MVRKYTPAVFQPTVRPSWVGILTYISKEEQAAILEAILKYPNQTDISSKFWDDAIEPDLKAQYTTFTQSNQDKGRASRDYWNKKGEDMVTNSLPMGEDMVTNSLPDDNHMENKEEDMVTILKDKSKDKDKDKSKDKDNTELNSKPLGKVFSRWLEYRKQIKKPYKSKMSIVECYNKLNKLSGGNETVAEKIVNQSIAQGWQGLFELKNEKGAEHGIDYNWQPEPGKYAGFGRKIEG